jgi:phospholipase C
MLLARYNPGSKAPETYADAYAAITRFGIGLFGTNDT